MKIVVYSSSEEINLQSSNLVIKGFEDMGYEGILYNIGERGNDQYYFNTKHFQEYQGVLNYCKEIKADILFFSNNVRSPEYLLSELEIRKNLRTQIIINFSLRESMKSDARANCMAKLLNMPQVKSGLLYSAIGNDLILPKNFLQFNPNTDKLKIIPDPIHYWPSDYCKSKEESQKIFWKYGVPALPVILFYGRLSYAKGIDILYESWKKYLRKDFILFVHGLSSTLDFDFDKNKLCDEGIFFHDKHVPNEKQSYIFGASDIVAIPYRQQYYYGSSGVMLQAAMSFKPCVVSDVYPLNQACLKYNIGAEFGLNNAAESFAIVVEKLNRLPLKEPRYMDYYKNNSSSWDDIAKLVVE
jgi:glycosyltransferase involved in cell wall biosynthesis